MVMVTTKLCCYHTSAEKVYSPISQKYQYQLNIHINFNHSIKRIFHPICNRKPNNREMFMIHCIADCILDSYTFEPIDKVLFSTVNRELQVWINKIMAGDTVILKKLRQR